MQSLFQYPHFSVVHIVDDCADFNDTSHHHHYHHSNSGTVHPGSNVRGCRPNTHKHPALCGCDYVHDSAVPNPRANHHLEPPVCAADRMLDGPVPAQRTHSHFRSGVRIMQDLQRRHHARLDMHASARYCVSCMCPLRLTRVRDSDLRPLH